MLQHNTIHHFKTLNQTHIENHSHSSCEPFSLPQEYGYVIIGVALICFSLILTGFCVVGRARKNIFSKQFMQQFQQIHEQNHSGDVTIAKGYPDMGSGFYSQKLTYKDWFDFNCAQRVHHQFLENIIPIVVFILFTGLYYPFWALGLCALTFVSRILFLFYLKEGGAFNRFRLFGSLGNMIVQLVGLGFSVYCGLKMACVVE